jgi:hypothetical protein
MPVIKATKRRTTSYATQRVNALAYKDTKLRLQQGTDELFTDIVAGINKLSEETGVAHSVVARAAFKTCKQQSLSGKRDINKKNAFVSIRMEELNKGKSHTTYDLCTHLVETQICRKANVSL